MRKRKPNGRARLTRVLALLCCLSVTVGSFAFFTDRVTQETEAVAGTMDLAFKDISSSRTGANGILSNNEFALDEAWKTSIITPGGVTNPGDFFDLSFELENEGSKSMDVRHRLVLLSTMPLSPTAPEYELTVMVGSNPIPVPGVVSDDGMVITYDLPTLLLNGSVEEEPDATEETRYTVRLAFDLEAGNEFMDSDVTVLYNAQAKQHRYSDASHWVSWAEYETSFDQVGDDMPGAVKLYGSGQIFYKTAPAELKFLSSMDRDKLQQILIDDVELDASSYTVTGEDNTFIALPIDYLQTLSLGGHDITAVFTDSSATARFHVADIVPTPDVEDAVLHGDGQVFNKMAPYALAFRSSINLPDVTEIRVDGEAIDPSNYTIRDNNSLFVLSIDYLQTLVGGDHEIQVISSAGASSAGFSVFEPVQDAIGFYYDVPYSVTEVDGTLTQTVSLLLREDGTAYLILSVDGTEDATGEYVCSTNPQGPMKYTISGRQISLTAEGASRTISATISADGETIDITIPGTGTLTLTQDDAGYIFVDEGYGYIYSEPLGGYAASPYTKAQAGAKPVFGPVRSNIYGAPVVCLSPTTSSLDTSAVTSVGLIGSGFAIELPDSLTTIGPDSFYRFTNLSTVVLPDNITSIGVEAFYYCDKLVSIHLPANLEVIGNSAFAECDSLTSITLPDKVEVIGDEAFYSCEYVTDVYIPASVTEIGDSAFGHLWQLEDVYYAGTQDQWNAITMGAGNGYLTGATIHFNSAG